MPVPSVIQSTAQQTVTLGVSASTAFGSAFGGGAHFGATSAREFARWYTSRGSADADLLPDLDILRQRNRDLERNYGIAGGIHTTLKDNIVGTGPRLSLMPDYRALGKDKDWAEAFSQEVEAGFRAWAESTDCDVTGRANLGILTRRVLHSRMLNGDAIILPIWRPDVTRRYGLQLQTVEADRLSNPFGRMDTDTMRGGVEIDEYGRPVAYNFQNAHPGDRWGLMTTKALTWERVPAETAWGRKRVLHCFDPERDGQNRGKPILAGVIGSFKMLDNYQRTEMQAAAINAVVAAFIETPMDAITVSEMLGAADGPASENKKLQSYMELQRELAVPMQGSMVMTLPPGTSMKPWAPNRPADQFGPFIESVIRNIGAGISMPYELVMKDWSKTNYSSARAALMEAWRMFATHRHWLKVFFLDQVLALWMEEAVFAGDLSITPEEYFANRFAYSRSKWIWPGRGWIDPVKEAQGSEIRMNIGTSTLEQECAEQGQDWEEVLDQRAIERQRAKDLGLTLGDNRPTQIDPPQDTQAK